MKKPKALITLPTDSEYKYFSHNYFEKNNFYDRSKIHKLEILHEAIKEQNKELITRTQRLKTKTNSRTKMRTKMPY